MEQQINLLFGEMREITSQLNQQLDVIVRHRDYMFERLMGEIQALKSPAAQAPSSPPPYGHIPPFQPSSVSPFFYSPSAGYWFTSPTLVVPSSASLFQFLASPPTLYCITSSRLLPSPTAES
jgi:hypothetical protein